MCINYFYFNSNKKKIILFRLSRERGEVGFVSDPFTVIFSTTKEIYLFQIPKCLKDKCTCYIGDPLLKGASALTPLSKGPSLTGSLSCWRLSPCLCNARDQTY